MQVQVPERSSICLLGLAVVHHYSTQLQAAKFQKTAYEIHRPHDFEQL
jgi:hypothetical protein